MKIVRALAAIFLPCALYAQLPSQNVSDVNFHGWYSYFGDHQVKGRWELHLEEQWRRHDGGLKWQQNLVRPGVNYVLNENVTFTAGYGHILSWPYGDYPAAQRNLEHRLWEQVNVTQRFSRFRFAHRFRQEQRWIREYDTEGDPVRFRYQNRFRYMGRVTIPTKGKWYSTFYDEIWFHISPNKGARTFDQNRAYAALGHKLSRNNSIEVGYMYQLLAQRNGVVTEHNHTLMVSFISKTPFGK